MKIIRLLPLALLIATASAHAQINMSAIDWNNFKGAKIIQSIDKEGKDNSSLKVTLNDDGKVTTQETFWKGKPFSKTTYKYDKQGRITECVRIPMTSEDKRGMVAYTYGYSEGKCEEVRSDDKGEVFERIVSVLDSKGLKTSEVHYNKDGSEGQHYEFGYDSRGNQTLMKCTGTNKDVVYSGAHPTMIINRLKYDDHNNPVSFEVSYDAEEASSTQTFSYTYDARGNWTKRISTFSHKGSSELQQRETEFAITY